jgi:hypothetical protein
MFIRNGHVAGSVLHSAVPAAPAETPKPAPAKKTAAPAKKTAPAPTAKKAGPAVTVDKEAGTDGNDNETR